MQPPPAPAPPVAPRVGVIAGPNTGDGGSAAGAGSSILGFAVLLGLVGGIALGGSGIGIARKRR
jgi:hypothetical protein